MRDVERRSYGQLCGLAVALDAIGERWTLLVVRDLLLGPRRYSDLLAGLPGLSTDLLADRLRTLESIGAVAKRKLPPPTSVTVYELTDVGLGLQPVVASLARWGERLLPQPGTPGYRIDAAWALLSMVSRYRGGLPDGQFELHLDDRTYTITVANGAMSVSDGPLRGSPLVTITVPAMVFLALVSGRTTMRTAQQNGLAIAGDSRLARRLLALLSLPTAPSPIRT